MKIYSLFLILLTVVFIACQRDDSEPTFGERKISRLYVSTSDYGGETSRVPNIYIIDPADSNVFPRIDSIRTFISGAKGGKFISYSPYNGGLVFQGSQNATTPIDTTVQVMQVNRSGALSSRGQLTTRRFNNVKGLDYSVTAEGTIVGDYLFLLNGNPQVADTMYIVSNVDRFVRPSRPRYHVKLDYSSWGVKVAGRNVFVSSYLETTRAGSFNGVIVYENLVTRLLANPLDTLLTGLNEIKLTIPEANNIRGLAYSAEHDLLVVTDYLGTGSNTTGRILFFENFSKNNSTSGELQVSREITSTGKLKRPLDVAIDARPEGKYIYVADADAKLVYRFLISDKGDVKPNLELDLAGRTPYSLSLDAR